MIPSEDLTDVRLAARLARQMAHDLNNVAAILSGHVYLLRAAAEPLEEGLEAVEKANDQMARMTQSLSALAALGDEAPAPFDLNELAHEEQRSAAQNGHALELDLEAGLPLVPGRKADLRRAIQALLANAREASPPGHPIGLRTRSVAEDGTVRLEIRDTGAGVLSGSEGRSFDPLFSTRGEKGRGIGLTVAVAVAAMHGGSCTLESTDGGGTAAVLALPVSR
ncbi:MAG: ATP-binding protein [Acidobacteriota bacterium]